MAVRHTGELSFCLRELSIVSPVWHFSDGARTTLPACLVAGLSVYADITRAGIVGLFLLFAPCLLGLLGPQSFCCGCPLMLLLQLLLLPLLLGPSVWSLALSNTLYALAFSVYFYITHLGYRCENCKSPRQTYRSGGARAECFLAKGVWSTTLFNIACIFSGFRLRDFL